MGKLVWLVWFGCGGPVDDFATIESEILLPSCAFSSCHGGGEGGLTLGQGVSYDALVGVEAATAPGEVRVVAGDSAASFLMAKLEGTATVGDVMPPDAPLDAEAIDRVAAWIDAGAEP